MQRLIVPKSMVNAVVASPVAQSATKGARVWVRVCAGVHVAVRAVPAIDATAFAKFDAERHSAS